MVHALEEIHRMLKPDGRLIDIHPMLEMPLIEGHQGDRILFVEPQQRSTDDIEIIGLAEEALAQIVQRDMFVIESSGSFDYLTYCPSTAELSDFLAKPSGVHETIKDEAEVAREAEQIARVEAIMQTAGEGAEIAFHEKGRIARLRPVR